MKQRGLARMLIVSLAVLFALGRGAWVLFGDKGARENGTSLGASELTIPSAPRIGPPSRFRASTLGVTLPAGVQDAAASALADGRFALLGGLNGADESVSSVTILSARSALAGPMLPEPQHDAQAVTLGGSIYVFGGGQVSSDEHILRYDPSDGRVTQAGNLPGPASDVAVTRLGSSAYIVGGFNGSQALDTILQWRPGQAAKVVGHLPSGLRYGALAAIDSQLVIAGGSSGETGEEASEQILSFNPSSGQLRPLGTLPEPLTHAAAVTLGSYVYVIGGRGSAAGSITSHILAIDPRNGTVRSVGRLPHPLSDEAAVLVNGRILLAGGQLGEGESDSIIALEPEPG